MHASARPLSRFANYETTGNDTYDRIWVDRLRDPGTDSKSIHLRPCYPSSALDDRYITENELITRVLAGDKHAELWFVRKFEWLVDAIMKDLQIHSQDRHDVVHQVFGKIWEQDCRRLRDWQAAGRGRLTSYLSTIIRRTVFDWLRKHMRTNRRPAFRVVDYIDTEYRIIRTSKRVCEISTATGTTIVVDTEAVTKLREQKRAIRRAVTEMLHRDSEILRRRYYFGQSHAEIAEAMAMTVKGVGAALSRAQKRMHNKLCLRHPGLFGQEHNMIQ